MLKEEIQEVSVSLATGNKISVDAAVFSELDGSLENKERHLRLSSLKDVFCFFQNGFGKSWG